MNGLQAVREIVYSLRDFLFPPVCPSCEGNLQADEIICSSCYDKLAAETFSYSPSVRIIGNTAEVSVLLPYDSMCRRIVHALKYHGVASIGSVMGKLMAQKTLKDFSVSGSAILIPVPLHPDKLLERGYNQSEYLARGFSSFSGHKIKTGILKRIKYTETQTHLSPDERSENVRNAFVFTGKSSLSEQDIILIDDVMTTGSTLASCVRTLVNGGAEKILVSVMATPDPGNE